MSGVARESLIERIHIPIKKDFKQLLNNNFIHYYLFIIRLLSKRNSVLQAMIFGVLIMWYRNNEM